MSSVAATIDKTRNDAGISFYQEHDGTIKILNIYSGSAWCDTALAEGMIVNRINHVTVSKEYSADDVNKMVEDCEGSLTIKAMFPDDDYDNTTPTSSSFPVVPTAPLATAPIPASSDTSAPLPPPPVTPVVVDAVVVPEDSFTANTISTTQPTITNTGATHPHHLVPNGGYWAKNTYVGDKTQCAALCCCLFVFGIGGLLILCCPLDERPVYVVNGMVYDRTGKRLGTINEVRVQN